jgi:hypothetical protein
MNPGAGRMPAPAFALAGLRTVEEIGLRIMLRCDPASQRNLLYTGVTRGKRLVVLVGQKKAVAIAVRSISERRRWSKLRDWLQSPDAGR